MKTRNSYRRKEKEGSDRCTVDDISVESPVLDLQTAGKRKTASQRLEKSQKTKRRMMSRSQKKKLESINNVKTHPLVANPLTSDARSFVLPPDVQQTYVDLFNTSLTMSFDLKHHYNLPEEAEQTKSKEAGEVEREPPATKPLKMKTRKRVLTPASPLPDMYLQENTQGPSLRDRVVTRDSCAIKRRKILFSKSTEDDEDRTFNFCETSKDSDSSDETEEEFFPDKIRKRHKSSSKSKKVQRKRTSTLNSNIKKKKRKINNYKKNQVVRRSLSKIIEKIKNRFQSDKKVPETNDGDESQTEKNSSNCQDAEKDLNDSKSSEDPPNNLHLMNGSDENELMSADPLLIPHPAEDQSNQKQEEVTTSQSAIPSRSDPAPPTKSSPTTNFREKLIHPRLVICSSS